MAMLAGPRRKQKVINLRAKNNAWSNDNSKFGQRMLERMGWSEGKGLGLKENGIVEHVVAKYKNDDKGLGFEDRNDQWTKHEDDFNSLLANLSNGDVKEDKLHSGISLEDKSKKSKARVHYHKFTRGKDLTQYSEKDLANIFGKKSLKKEEKIEKPVNADLKTTTEQVFTEKGSMEDYFKNKLAAIKSKSKIRISHSIEDENETDYMFRGFSGTKRDTDESETYQSFAFNPFSQLNNPTDPDNTQKLESTLDNERCKTKKKYKKNKCNEETESLVKSGPNYYSDSLNMEFDNMKDSSYDCDKKKKKKKGVYQEMETMENNHTENNLLNSTYSNLSENSNIEETKTKKAKKSKRKKDIETENSQNNEFAENDNVENNCNLTDIQGKKKKKLKNNKYEQLQEESQEAINNISETHDDCHIPKKKKKRKNKEVLD